MIAQFFRFIAWWLFNRHTPITVINDCRCDNARGRMMTRLASYFPGVHLEFIGVKNDVEAAVNLIDTLDALDIPEENSRSGIIVLNVAPRNGSAKKWPNGTPFGELTIGRARIFCTIDGLPLRFLAKMLGRQLSVRVYDIPEIAALLGISLEVQERTIDSQYRSFDFLTRLIAARVKGKALPHTTLNVMPSASRPVVGWIDNFGNCKTTAVSGELLMPGVKFYPRLKDVPDGEFALIVGSSGIGEARFLELVVQGGSAATVLGDPDTGEEVEKN